MGINRTVAEDLKTMILIPKSGRNKTFMQYNNAESSFLLFISNTSVQLQCFGVMLDKCIINVLATLNAIVCLL